MGGLREWVMQLVGVVMIGVVCDIIMTDGEIKKYVKPIIGVVLVFTIILPISKISVSEIRSRIIAEANYKSSNILEMAEEIQAKHIKEMYEKGLEEETKRLVEEKLNFDKDVVVDVSAGGSGHADIECVDVVILAEDNALVNCEEIKRSLGKELGIDNKYIEVSLKGRG